MDSLGFDSFTKKIYIRTTREKMYYCWATEEGICSWFLRNASYRAPSGLKRTPGEFVAPGDHYL